MIVTRIKGKYNITGKEIEPAEIVPELMKAVMMIKEDIYNTEDDGYDYIGIIPLVENECC